MSSSASRQPHRRVERRAVSVSERDAVDAANVIILPSLPRRTARRRIRATRHQEKRVGLATGRPGRAVPWRADDASTISSPSRVGCSRVPIWSGLIQRGAPYSPFTYNVERLVPWRTLTGRQHFYLDHEGYIAFGEHLPTYKPTPRPGGLRRPREESRSGRRHQTCSTT